MRKLETRLAKLESDCGTRRGALAVAVVQSPFPSGDPQEWALSILDRLNGAAAVWVVEGEAFTLLLDPTDAFNEAAMPCDGEAERRWLSAGNTYPHYLICGDGRGGMLVERINSEADERELARQQEPGEGVLGE